MSSAARRAYSRNWSLEQPMSSKGARSAGVSSGRWLRMTRSSGPPSRPGESAPPCPEAGMSRWEPIETEPEPETGGSGKFGSTKPAIATSDVFRAESRILETTMSERSLSGAAPENGTENGGRQEGSGEKGASTNLMQHALIGWTPNTARYFY